MAQASEKSNRIREKSVHVISTPTNIFKVRMCTFYMNGTCLRGENCTYAHSLDELRAQPNLIKTHICDQWRRGICRNQSSPSLCKYAHGINDLNTLQNTSGNEFSIESEERLDNKSNSQLSTSLSCMSQSITNFISSPFVSQKEFSQEEKHLLSYPNTYEYMRLNGRISIPAFYED